MRTIIKFMVLLLWPLLLSGLVSAQDTKVSATFSKADETIPINILVGQSRVISFDPQIGRFSVSNPEVAEAVLVAPDQVLVNGKSSGQVNFIAWNKSDSKFMVFDVFVRVNLSLVDTQIHTLFPKEDIRLSQAHGSVVLSGTVSDTRIASQIDSIVQAAGFKTVNLLKSPVKDAAQVQLQIRVAEVYRNRLKDFGTSYAYQSSPGRGGYLNSGAGPYSMGKVERGDIFGSVSNALNLFVMGGNTYNFIRVLQQQGALRSLAEPNLIAVDGQQASFLAGGEFPVPIVQPSIGGSALTILFKEFGVRLNFKPTIIDEDHIRLELEPEVSSLDWGNGIRLEGFVIPALRTRRAKTGIELRDGQSFALAGLLDNSESKSLSKIPLIGDIPVLGQLFTSKQFAKNETELMFIVTANLVKPLNKDEIPSMRGMDGLKTGSPLGVEPKGEGITGESGYSIDGNGETKEAVMPSSKPSVTLPADPVQNSVSQPTVGKAINTSGK
jgi:pilus assembly protein CpaC